MAKGNERREVITQYRFIGADEATHRPAFNKRRHRISQAMEGLVTALTPDRVARMEMTGPLRLAGLRQHLYEAAARLGRPVEVWAADGVLYAGLAEGATVGAAGAAAGDVPTELLAALIKLRNEGENSVYHYHRLDLGGGVLLDGIFDLAPYVPQYGLPDRLDGMTVLDVGTASGFWALEMARRGATVTALDLGPPSWIEALAVGTGLPIQYAQRDLYTLDEAFGTFDLVFCGSVLFRLPDQLGALRALRRVCRGQLIVATLATEDSATTARPACDFLGLHTEAGGGDWTYWAVSAVALKRMLVSAEFQAVTRVAHLTLTSTKGEHNLPHVVMTAAV